MNIINKIFHFLRNIHFEKIIFSSYKVFSKTEEWHSNILDEDFPMFSLRDVIRNYERSFIVKKDSPENIVFKTGLFFNKKISKFEIDVLINCNKYWEKRHYGKYYEIVEPYFIEPDEFLKAQFVSMEKSDFDIYFETSDIGQELHIYFPETSLSIYRDFLESVITIRFNTSIKHSSLYSHSSKPEVLFPYVKMNVSDRNEKDSRRLRHQRSFHESRFDNMPTMTAEEYNCVAEPENGDMIVGERRNDGTVKYY